MILTSTTICTLQEVPAAQIYGHAIGRGSDLTVIHIDGLEKPLRD